MVHSAVCRVIVNATAQHGRGHVAFLCQQDNDFDRSPAAEESAGANGARKRTFRDLRSYELNARGCSQFVREPYEFVLAGSTNGSQRPSMSGSEHHSVSPQEMYVQELRDFREYVIEHTDVEELKALNALGVRPDTNGS